MIVSLTCAFILVTGWSLAPLALPQRPPGASVAAAPAPGPWLPVTLAAAPVAPRLSAPRYCPDVVPVCQRIRDAYNDIEVAVSRQLASIPYTPEAFCA